MRVAFDPREQEASSSAPQSATKEARPEMEREPSLARSSPKFVLGIEIFPSHPLLPTALRAGDGSRSVSPSTLPSISAATSLEG